MLAFLWLGAALAEPRRAEVHVGTRDSFTEAGVVEGVKLGGGLHAGAWGLLSDLYVGAGYERISGDVETLLRIADEAGVDAVLPEDVDRASLSVLARWTPGPPTGRDGRPWGRPAVLLGVEARRVNRIAVGLSDGEIPMAEVREATAYWSAGPAAGFAFEAGTGGPLAARLSVLDRTHIAPSPTTTGDAMGDGWRLQQDPTLSLDLCWSFGGGAR